MAQHIPIANFPQKAMRAIEDSIRKERYFRTSMRFESLPADYSEDIDDEVFVTRRATPRSISGVGRETFEVHTKPHTHGRIATNIYVIV